MVAMDCCTGKVQRDRLQELCVVECECFSRQAAFAGERMCLRSSEDAEVVYVDERLCCKTGEAGSDL